MSSGSTEYALPRALLDRVPDPLVVVAMSGGVDSSVAALRLRRAGVRCTALFMKNWNEPTDDGACAWEDDVADALAVCERLDIEINTVDFSQDYWDGVFEDFLREYRAGRTPNPDVLCNREIKFRTFLDHARALGGDCIATGHYVSSDVRDGRFRLLRGADARKDQSYFLYTLGQQQLAASLFPVGDLHKAAVRGLAREAGLATHEKKDSTGICFIGEQPFRAFLSRYLPSSPGPILTPEGRVLGEHPGAVFFTLGQRQGLGIGGVDGADEGPWYVVAKDLENNAVVVAQGHDHPLLMSSALDTAPASWVAGEAPAMPLSCTARTRYRQSDQRCVVEARDGGRLRLRFDAPQRAVTPGQSVVLYDGPACLGGAVIDATQPVGVRAA